MDKVIDKLAGLGVAGIVLACVISTSGLTGVYALTAALSTLGGPFGGMYVGIAMLGLIAMTTAFISKWGIDKTVILIVQKMVEKGHSKSRIIKDLDKYPWKIVLSKDLRLLIKDKISKA